MSLEDQAVLLIECLNGKIEIAIQTDPFETIDEPQNLTSDWNENFKKLLGTENTYIVFIKTGEIPTDPMGSSHMSVKKNLVVGFFLVTINLSISKMEDSHLRDVLLTSANIAALILEEKKKTVASQKEDKQLDDGKLDKAAKIQVTITKEGDKNVVLQLDINSEEDINKLNKLIETIYLVEQKNDK